MSNSERPDFQALEELEAVLGHLSEATASWRRRALTAEANEADMVADPDSLAVRERIADLEGENAALAARLAAARDRVERLVERLRFLEDQMVAQERAG